MNPIIKNILAVIAGLLVGSIVNMALITISGKVIPPPTDADITTMEGECVLLETIALDKAQEDKVIARFTDDRNEQYQELLGRCKDFEVEIAKEISIQKFTYAELDEEETDLKKLENWYEKIQKLDFYGAPLAQVAQERLQDCKARLDEYAQMVYDTHEENR